VGLNIQILVGAHPCGGVVFISRCFLGQISDVSLVEACGFAEYLDAGDSVMADKGFLIWHILHKKGAMLVIPPKRRRGQGQLNLLEEAATVKVANLRICVENTMRRIKQFRILNSVVPLNRIPFISDIVEAIAFLTNYGPPVAFDKNYKV